MKRIVIVVCLVVFAFVAGSMVNSWVTCSGFCPVVQNMTPVQFSRTLESKQVNLLDVRTAAEYSAGHIKNAVNIDYYQTESFRNYLDSLDREAEYLIYCRTGNRSGQAAKIMKEMGFKNISDLSGGIVAWQENNLPVEQ